MQVRETSDSGLNGAVATLHCQALADDSLLQVSGLHGVG